jgi:spore coat polysaccharide biosynthesis predicted glycosyltransferase SpsG
MSRPVSDLETRLKCEGFKVARAAGNPGSPHDALDLLGLAKVHDASWLVLDGYQFGVDYQYVLKNGGMKVLVLDDCGQICTYAANIVLDQNAGASEHSYRNCESYTELLLGTRYAMLRREFKVWREWKRPIAPVARKILATMGGSDPRGLTLHVIRSLRRLESKDIEVLAVMGGGSPHAQALKARGAAFEGNIRVLESARNMPELMAWADIAVITGGGTLWELLYMMCPVVSFAANAQQNQILSGLHSQGTVQFVGAAHGCDQAKLSAVIFELASYTTRRREMSANGRATIDGLGAARVCEVMLHGNSIGNQFEDAACVVARS